MGVVWNLSLVAKCDSEAEKINQYAKELYKQYNLELHTDEDGGLLFYDWGFCYIDVDAERLMSAEKMIDQVVAHFPDINLTFQGSGDGPCYQWEKRSKSGVLVEVQPWRVGIHCENHSFDELLTHTPFIQQQGFDVQCEEGEMALYWEYDHLTEESLCNQTIVQLSKKMPQTTIYSFKRIMMDNVYEIETFCTMKDGVGEWIVDESYEGLVEYNRPTSIWEIIKDPESCFEQLLDKQRRGEDTKGATVYITLLYSVKYDEYDSDCKELARWLALFKAEDKQWLTTAEATIYDCIVLAGMHHNWHSENSYAPLFEYNREDEQRLFNQVAASWNKLDNREIRLCLYLLKLTNLDYKPILQEYIEWIKPYRDPDDEQLQWLCKEIGEI